MSIVLTIVQCVLVVTNSLYGEMDHKINSLMSHCCTSGMYCILKKGDCPKDFNPGWIYWDDAAPFFGKTIQHESGRCLQTERVYLFPTRHIRPRIFIHFLPQVDIYVASTVSSLSWLHCQFMYVRSVLPLLTGSVSEECVTSVDRFCVRGMCHLC